MKNGKIKTTLENLLRKIVRNKKKKKSLKGAIKYAKKENQREKQLTIQKKKNNNNFFIFPFLVCSSYILVTINLCKFFFSFIFKKNAVGYKMSLTFATLEEF